MWSREESLFSGQHRNLVAQLYLTPWEPMDCSPPGSSFHGILQARILECVAISFSRGSSQLRDRTQVSCIDRQILYCLSQQGSSGQHRTGQKRLHFLLLISRDSGGSENAFVCWTLGCQRVVMEMLLALIRSLFGFLIKRSSILSSFTIPFTCHFLHVNFLHPILLYLTSNTHHSWGLLYVRLCSQFLTARPGFAPKAGWLQHPCSHHNTAELVTHSCVTLNCLRGMRCCHRDKWIKMSKRGSLKNWK